MKNSVILLCIFFAACSSNNSELFDRALQNGYLANEGFTRSERFVKAWLAEADSISGLIPRNLTVSRHFWNAWDAAADNYPFMVMTASILRPDSFESPRKPRTLGVYRRSRGISPTSAASTKTYPG